MFFLICFSAPRRDQSSALWGFSYTVICFHKKKPDCYLLWQSQGGLQAVLEVKILQTVPVSALSGCPKPYARFFKLLYVTLGKHQISQPEQVGCAGRLAYDQGTKNTSQTTVSYDSKPV